jgi:hypothetical protein
MDTELAVLKNDWTEESGTEFLEKVEQRTNQWFAKWNRRINRWLYQEA